MRTKRGWSKCRHSLKSQDKQRLKTDYDNTGTEKVNADIELQTDTEKCNNLKRSFDEAVTNEIAKCRKRDDLQRTCHYVRKRLLVDE